MANNLSNTNDPQAPERTPDYPQTLQEQVFGAKDLPDEVKSGLVWLRAQGATEADVARRGHFRRMLEAEEFWKGNHYAIWSERDSTFLTPWNYAAMNGKFDDQPIYQYVVNIYQAMGLTVIAALSQRIPKVRFLPHSAQSEEDIATAKAASDIAELIERNNHLKTMARREAYLLWTQGGFGTYTRFVRDPKQGLEAMPIMENMLTQITPDGYNCQGCQNIIPANNIQMNSGNGMIGESESGTCPDCNGKLTAADFVQGESAELPVVSGYKKIPKGFEKMSVYGFLNLKMMPYVSSFEGTGYLHLVEDIPEGALRAAYPTLANEIGTNSTAGDTFASDTYEKAARLRLFEAPIPHTSSRLAGTHTAYLTYSRVWLRSWYLWQHPDENIRKKLLEYFPDGCYAAFAGDKLLEARNENIDDVWTICSGMPGYGLYSEAIGASTIPLQKQINDAANVVAEHLDFGSAPPILYDAEFLSGEALKSQKMRPGMFVPAVRSRGGSSRSLSELIFQPNLKIDTNIYGYGRSLMEIIQVTSGALPSLFGGQLQGNATASAYRQSRDQAMGKLLLFWAAVKEHHASSMMQGVDCFRRNRTSDEEWGVAGTSGEVVSKYVRLMDLQGNIVAEPEADEDFPATWAEIRENLLGLMQENPQAANLLGLFEPANSNLLKRFVGSPNLIVPVEASREKQFREIDELLEAQPIQVPDPASPIGANGVPTGTKYVSTIAPDVHGDDHVTEIKTIIEWVSSANGGMLAKKENPMGFANVMSHLIDHKTAMAEAQAFDRNLMLQFGLAPPQEGEPQGGAAPQSQSPNQS